ncbi:MAG: alpha/beta hydrolase [Rhodococcus sp.]|nr:alpha/beta hydrolase [Rhodococcus sp. (in: high G+C Gram-positive bacteria)]
MRRLGLLAIVLALCSACGAGPSTRPHVAVEHEGGGSASTSTEIPHPDAPPPPLESPKSNVAWTECTQEALDRAGVGPAPAGAVLECGHYEAPIDKSGAVPGTFQVGVLRARNDRTPPDAAPLVFTSGSDRASTEQLAALVVSGFVDLLSTRPVVAVDRRGIGTSLEIDCLTDLERRSLMTLDPPVGEGDRIDRMTAMGREATIACTDYLQPQELAFDASHAADDIEALRELWDVPTIGLLGTGNGTAVALSYAARYPDRLGRLVLDSPTAPSGDAVAVTEDKIRGREAAVDVFARQCAALDCSLGADPRGAVTELVNRARAGDVPELSANDILTAIATTLGSPTSDDEARVQALSDTLSAATQGDVVPLLGLVAESNAAVHRDGQLIARCSDGQRWPAPGHVRELEQKWADAYPLFGAAGAVGLLSCSAWPATAPLPLPTAMSVPVLVMTGAADPVTGNGGVDSARGAVGAAGAPTATLTWHGSGHPVSSTSCARSSIVAYVDTGALPADGNACPA